MRQPYQILHTCKLNSETKIQILISYYYVMDKIQTEPHSLTLNASRRESKFIS